MARVIVTADLHLDAGRHSPRNPETGVKVSWESARRCLAAAVDEALSAPTDAFVFAGDAFLNGWPRVEAAEMFADELRRMVRAGVKVIAVRGNHELIGLPLGQRDPFARLVDVGVEIVTHASVVRLASGLQVACLPWPAKTDLPEDHALASETLGWQVANLAEQVRDDGPSLFVGHLALEEATLGSSSRGSEVTMGLLAWEPMVSVAHLEAGPWSACVLGHVHKRQFLGVRTHYVGSPDRVDFGEEHHVKAFSVITVGSDGKATVEERETPARQMRTVDLTKGESLDGIAPGCILRVITKPGYDDVAIRKAVVEAGAYLARVVTIREATKGGDAERTVDPDDPLKMLRGWLAERKVSQDLMDRVMQRAVAIMEDCK